MELNLVIFLKFKLHTKIYALKFMTTGTIYSCIN